MDHSRIKIIPLTLLFLCAALFVTLSRPTAAETTTAAPDWLEPQGLNLVTLTGLLPESTLRDTVVVWIPGSGTVVYDSGVVNGGNIEVTVRYDLTNSSEVWCPAEPPQLDHSGTVLPPSTMRVFAGGADITSQIGSGYQYTVAGQIQPSGGAFTQFSRYPRLSGVTQVNSNGEIIVPANRGCKFSLGGSHDNVTATFTMPFQDNIAVTEVYRHVDNGVRSYIGIGNVGDLSGLRRQMLDFGTRHHTIVDWFSLSTAQKSAIAQSDYVLLKYPPSSHDPYGGTGDAYGTYRFAFNTGLYEWLSVDHVSAKLLPRLGHWRDADTQSGQQFLDYFQALYPHGANIFENFDGLKSAELILPPGIPYQSCMTAGNCPQSLLQTIFNHTYTAEAFFYRIERINNGGLEQVPLLSVGPTYSRSAEVGVDSAEPLLLNRLAGQVFLPLLEAPPAPPPPDNPSACPGGCGWFDQHGQMLDFVAPPSWNFP